nr:hypothetical protein [Gammaproteobacteria bacterium]
VSVQPLEAYLEARNTRAATQFIFRFQLWGASKDKKFAAVDAVIDAYKAAKAKGGNLKEITIDSKHKKMLTQGELQKAVEQTQLAITYDDVGLQLQKHLS